MYTAKHVERPHRPKVRLFMLEDLEVRPAICCLKYHERSAIGVVDGLGDGADDF